jgi:5-methylcytosine-specific restriction endonuclease McrA
MAKHVFSPDERFIVYLADGGKCFWCGQPLIFRDVQVDHVFPKNLLEKNETLQQIKTDYALGEDFKINGFENWVTCHQGCNLRKSDSILPNAPRTLFTVNQLRARAPKLEAEQKKFVSRRRAGEILGQMACALTTGSLTQADVMEIMVDVPMASGSAEVKIQLTEHTELIVPNSPAAFSTSQGWKIHSVTGNIAHVHDGIVGGMIPNVANPHESWRCSQCGFFGPWDGIICRTCGNREEPDC